MKALTVQQPWAQCIAEGAKLIENRTWSTSYRGLLAIHAGKGWDRDAPEGRHVLSALALWTYHPDPGPALRPDTFPRGVIAVGELVDCHLATGCCEPWGERGYYNDRPVYHWVLAEVRALDEPLPARGRQRLWDIDLQAVDW